MSAQSSIAYYVNPKSAGRRRLEPAIAGAFGRTGCRCISRPRRYHAVRHRTCQARVCFEHSSLDAEHEQFADGGKNTVRLQRAFARNAVQQRVHVAATKVLCLDVAQAGTMNLTRSL